MIAQNRMYSGFLSKYKVIFFVFFFNDFNYFVCKYTVTPNRSFPIALLETYSRNNIGQDRLTGFDVVNIYRNYNTDIDMTLLARL